jgi:hypothetical protein
VQAITGVESFQDLRDALHQPKLVGRGQSLVIDTVQRAQLLAEQHVIRTVKNEDGLAPLKKQVQQLITTTAVTIDGAVMALTTSPDDPVEVIAAGPNQIEKPAELKVFKANVESFIDAAGATLDIKSNQRFAYGLSATAYRSVADNTTAIAKTATTNLTPAWLLRKLAAKPAAGDSVSLAVDEDFETPSTIFVWDITDVATVPPVEPAWELKEHFGGVSSFYVDGTNLFSTSYDQTVCIWDISPAEQDRYRIDSFTLCRVHSILKAYINGILAPFGT